MDWLSKLPVIGPAATWLMTTHLWRAYERMLRVHWTRLAAAITFTSFVALFPLLTVAAAIGAALLSDGQLHKLEGKIAEQIPGISEQLDIAGTRRQRQHHRPDRRCRAAAHRHRLGRVAARLPARRVGEGRRAAPTSSSASCGTAPAARRRRRRRALARLLGLRVRRGGQGGRGDRTAGGRHRQRPALRRRLRDRRPRGLPAARLHTDQAPRRPAAAPRRRGRRPASAPSASNC